MLKNKEWVVYILHCDKDGSLYTGITNNLEKRLKAHASGRGAKYTRGRGPFVCLCSVVVRTKSYALKEEARIKKLSRSDKVDYINCNGLVGFLKD